GKALTDPAFAKIWAEIDRRALPVLVHPTAPPGAKALGLHEFQLTAPIGFTFDTSLAVARCIYDGFLDRFPHLKLIAAHGGGALPYLVGRLDICWDNIPAAHAKTTEPPRNYLRRVFVDSVVFRQDVLDMCVSENEVARRARVSRTPVREALFRLEREGYLEVHAKSGWSVRTLDFELLDNLYDLRVVLETAAVRRLCQGEPRRALAGLEKV